MDEEKEECFICNKEIEGKKWPKEGAGEIVYICDNCDIIDTMLD